MSRNQDVFDISVLRKNPQAFILGCQQIIHICVRQYIGTKMFKSEEMDDMIQSVNEELIKKLPVISEQFNGTAQLRTYMGVIIKNICLKLYRDAPKNENIFPISATMPHYLNDPANKLIITDEIQRFDTLLTLLPNVRNKTIFYMKLYLKIPIDESDISRYLPMILLSDKERLMKTFGTDYTDLTIDEIFEIAAPVINRCEQKHSSADSHRRLAFEKVQHFIKVLNGDPPLQNYTEESLKTLIEEYFLTKYKDK
jgi:RNA polymerase sigma factor (sigma-70 family)